MKNFSEAYSFSKAEQHIQTGKFNATAASNGTLLDYADHFADRIGKGYAKDLLDVCVNELYARHSGLASTKHNGKLNPYEQSTLAQICRKAGITDPVAQAVARSNTQPNKPATVGPAASPTPAASSAANNAASNSTPAVKTEEDLLYETLDKALKEAYDTDPHCIELRTMILEFNQASQQKILTTIESCLTGKAVERFMKIRSGYYGSAYRPFILWQNRNVNGISAQSIETLMKNVANTYMGWINEQLLFWIMLNMYASSRPTLKLSCNCPVSATQGYFMGPEITCTNGSHDTVYIQGRTIDEIHGHCNTGPNYGDFKPYDPSTLVTVQVYNGNLGTGIRCKLEDMASALDKKVLA